MTENPIEILEEEKQKGYAFLNESESIVKQIIEKIISLVITEVEKKKVENRIPDFCFIDMRATLEMVTGLDLITYDKDDLDQKQGLSFLNIKSEKGNSIHFPDEDSIFKIESFFKNPNEQSEIMIEKYKLENELDPNCSVPCSIDAGVFAQKIGGDEEKEGFKEKDIDKRDNKEKIVLGILKKESQKIPKTLFNTEKKRNYLGSNNKVIMNSNNIELTTENNKEPFINDNIEKIQVLETHKIDIPPKVSNFGLYESNNFKKKRPNLLYDTVIEFSNVWELPAHPKAVPIDRDASTKIIYQKPIEKNFHKEEEENKINKIKESKIMLNTSPNEGKEKEKERQIKKMFSSVINKNEKSPPKKPKKPPIIDLPFWDIDPKVFIKEFETEELAALREELEKDLELKRIEQAKKEKIEKEKQAQEQARLERDKELKNKNITVDVNGNILFIKPIEVNALVTEFKKGKSNSKEIKTVEAEIVQKFKNRKNITVEKNMEFLNDKDDKKRKKADKFKIGRNLQSSKSKKSGGEMNKTSSGFSADRFKNAKFAAGSNFDIISLECGVNLKEDSKMKSGGRDFFKKYNKYSVEVFKDQLSKTATSNFYPTQKNMMMPSLKQKSAINGDKNKPLMEIIEHNKTSVEPGEDNNVLCVKTGNLRLALSNLDLITEAKEKELASKKNIKKNFIKITKKPKPIKLDYGEMNVFAKTLMGSDNWGTNTMREKQLIGKSKVPTKPEENELKREVPYNMLNKMPRKRLPPIPSNKRLTESIFGQTAGPSGFYSKRKKIKPINTETDEGKESKTGKKIQEMQNTESNFHQNTAS